jgi:1-acyl-sn-glycerol-3-phosphate acyltransferase
MIVLRAAFFNAAFTLWTVLIGICALPVLAAPRRINARFDRFWVAVSLKLLAWIVGLTHEVRGAENLPSEPAIVALKHQSAWDTLFLPILLKDPAIIAKRELLRIPIFGWYLWRGGVIAIDRKSAATALRQIVEGARKAKAEGRSIAIFPEGTRSAVGGHLPYQPGIAALYSQLGLPIVPVALNSGLFWPRNSYMKKPGRVMVEILPPIPPGQDRRQVISELQSRIESATDRLVAEAMPALGGR